MKQEIDEKQPQRTSKKIEGYWDEATLQQLYEHINKDSDIGEVKEVKQTKDVNGGNTMLLGNLVKTITDYEVQ